MLCLSIHLSVWILFQHSGMQVARPTPWRQNSGIKRKEKTLKESDLWECQNDLMKLSCERKVQQNDKRWTWIIYIKKKPKCDVWRPELWWKNKTKNQEILKCGACCSLSSPVSLSPSLSSYLVKALIPTAASSPIAESTVIYREK